LVAAQVVLLPLQRPVAQTAGALSQLAVCRPSSGIAAPGASLGMHSVVVRSQYSPPAQSASIQQRPAPPGMQTEPALHVAD
jgi:hypothetical protein